jgi:N-acetylated-alpha-linked acidic dipeptidase
LILFSSHSIESLPSTISYSDLARVDFARLRDSFAKLQNASIALDSEKKEAEEKFLELLEQMPRFPGGGGVTSHHSHCGGFISSLTRTLKNAIKRIFGISTSSYLSVDPWFPTAWVDFIGLAGVVEEEEMEVYMRWLEYRLVHEHHTLASSVEEGENGLPGLPELPELPVPIPPIREFIKAAKRVSRSNKKLMGFERGFIHENGIREREWYRHLGVAPGKWLGEFFSLF